MFILSTEDKISLLRRLLIWKYHKPQFPVIFTSDILVLIANQEEELFFANKTEHLNAHGFYTNIAKQNSVFVCLIECCIFMT